MPATKNGDDLDSLLVARCKRRYGVILIDAGTARTKFARWLAPQAKYVNVVYDADIEVRLLTIPAAWRTPEPGVFKEESMRDMADVGRRLGADPGSWELLADGRP